MCSDKSKIQLKSHIKERGSDTEGDETHWKIQKETGKYKERRNRFVTSNPANSELHPFAAGCGCCRCKRRHAPARGGSWWGRDHRARSSCSRRQCQRAGPFQPHAALSRCIRRWVGGFGISSSGKRMVVKSVDEKNRNRARKCERAKHTTEQEDGEKKSCKFRERERETSPAAG